MKWLIVLGVVAAGAVGCLSGADDKSAPVMPTEVTLTTGRVLRNVSVVRWETNRVVLKYTGGVDPISFTLISEPLRSQLSEIREGARKAEARARELNQNPAAAKADEQIKYQGQVFIVTRGAGNYKMGGVTVYVLPESDWHAMQSSSQPVFLSKPLAAVASDADGKFEFSLPKGMPFVVLAQGRRSVGSREEQYEWRDRSDNMKQLPQILLSNDNHSSSLRSYRFSD